MQLKRLKIVISVVLCILTAAVYLRTAWYPFSGNDDPEYVAQNIHVLSGISPDSIQWAFSSFYAANWHPLTWLSLMLDAQLFGSNPMGYHIVNVAFHIANTALLFFLFTFMTGAVWRSALVAALFALHPQHVESVVWITERKDVLSTLFLLVTLYLYAAYVKNSGRRMYFLSLAAFACGLMAKPMLVTVPVILMLLDYWPLGRLELQAFSSLLHGIKALLNKRRFMEKLPFFALSAVMSIVTVYAQRQTVATITDVPLLMRIANALWSTLQYAAKMIVPINLAAYYPFVPVPFWEAFCAALLLVTGLYLAVRKVHRFPYLAVGLFWFLVTLLPVIGLIQVGGQAMADRYSYIPHIGLFIMASWGAADLATIFSRMRGGITAVAGSAMAVYTVITCVQVSYWKDDITLYSHSLAVTHDNAFAHNMLGIAHSNGGNGELALKEYMLSLRLNPDDPGVHRNLGLVLDKQLGMSAEAVKHFEIADRLEPNNQLVHYHMAKALLNMGRINDAVAEYTKALKITPDDPYFHNDLGMALLMLNKNDEAVMHISEALRLMPSFGQAAANLQFALSRKTVK